MSIPKIIHQLWIGSKPAPINLMNTWKTKNPDFEYILWNEDEILKREMIFKCQEKIDDIEEINGKADIMRWEILFKYGGVFLDADSICIEPIDEELLNKKCFAGWEQEEARPGLIATGTMGFPKEHLLVERAIDWILKNDVSLHKSGMYAWQSVGPGLLTRINNNGEFNCLHIFPSFYFLPIHYLGIEYTGHRKIYAYQEWGSTKKNYDIMNNIELPKQFINPPKEKSVSILVSSFNTRAEFIKDCLNSIKIQTGYFNMELVWINDGSDKLHTTLLKKHLDNFIKTSRFTTLIYNENETNKGIGYSLNKGVQLCSNEIIIKMDSDDIMINNRIEKQLEFMDKNPQIMICGCQIHGFKDNIDNTTFTTNHPTIKWCDFIDKKPHWFVNHPSLCYRKSAILECGNYDAEKSKMIEDFDMELRMLKHYGIIFNFPEAYLYYRIHDKQITHNGGNGGSEYWNEIRMNLINNIINS
jgi:mannosyltransferase OCH1-like enzyme